MRAKNQSQQKSETTRSVLLIAGPTASGKSAMAMDVAEHFSGTVINADSQQVYSQLQVLSARPSEADEMRVPHRLFGVVDGNESCSAGRWVDLAVTEIKAAWASERLPIVVGGTGMYLQALTEGMSPIPEVPAAVRAAARARYDELGAEAFHDEVTSLDPATGAVLPTGDTQRLLRAWEVTTHTKRPFSDWQKEPRQAPLPEARFITIALQPPRDQLYAAINERFSRMVDEGALDEVRALLALGIDPALPVMKALGVAQLAAFIQGDKVLEDVVDEARQLSRNYAKRQLTWVRNQIHADYVLSAQYSKSFCEEILSFIHQFLLTNPV